MEGSFASDASAVLVASAVAEAAEAVAEVVDAAVVAANLVLQKEVVPVVCFWITSFFYWNSKNSVTYHKRQIVIHTMKIKIFWHINRTAGGDI